MKIPLSITPFQLLFTLLLVESIVIYLLAPRQYTQSYDTFCMYQFLLSTVLFFFFKKKKNYFDFDTIFIFSYFCVMFIFPVFLAEDIPASFFSFQFEYNEDVISRSTALSLVGIQAYYWGSSLVKGRPLSVAEIKKPPYRIPSDIVILIAGGTFVLYILLGGYSSLKGVYAGTERPESSLAEYIYLFTPVSLIVLVVLEIWNKTVENPRSFSWKHVNSFTLLLIIFYIFSLLVIGKRAMPLQVILTAAGLYTFFYKPLSLLRIIPLIIGGIVVMYLLAVFRDTSGSLDFQLAESLMDLIINNRNTFIAVDYVDTNGITWGKSMLAYIVSVIPFLQSVIHTVLGVDPVDMASSLIITRISLGSDDFTVGFGTNIIADLYMAWGGAGVVILMALLGYFISWLLKKAAGSIYALTAYGVMMSYAVFSVRAEYTFPLQILLWSLLMVNIVKHYNFRLTMATAKENKLSATTDPLQNKS